MGLARAEKGTRRRETRDSMEEANIVELWVLVWLVVCRGKEGGRTRFFRGEGCDGG